MTVCWAVTLRKMPPMTLDFCHGSMTVNGVKLNLGLMVNLYPEQQPVTARDTLVIPAGTEQMVVCHLSQVQVRAAERFFVEEICPKLAEKDAVICPALLDVKDNECKILVSNPSNEPQKIYANAQVSVAQRVIDDRALGPPAEINAIQPASADDGIITDPKYVINYDELEVSPAEKEEFRKLVKEFSSIFSKSAYDLGCSKAGAFGIVTTTETSVRSKFLRIPHKYNAILRKHIDQLERSGALVKSDTPWVSSLNGN